MSDDFTFYWRILSNSQELEGVMVVKGTSYAAVGWRPLSLKPTCKGFPYLEDPKPVVSTTEQPTASALPEPEPEPSAEPEPEPEPSAEPEPKGHDHDHSHCHFCNFPILFIRRPID